MLELPTIRGGETDWELKFYRVEPEVSYVEKHGADCNGFNSEVMASKLGAFLKHKEAYDRRESPSGFFPGGGQQKTHPLSEDGSSLKTKID